MCVPQGGIQLHAEHPPSEHTAQLAVSAGSSPSPLLCSNPGTVASRSPLACHPTCRAGSEIPHVGTLCGTTYLGKKVFKPILIIHGVLCQKKRKVSHPDPQCTLFSDLAIITPSNFKGNSTHKGVQDLGLSLGARVFLFVFDFVCFGCMCVCGLFWFYLFPFHELQK